ncbi:RNA binding domain containing protein [Diplocarpon rosae]|nr:RNA binding domain containing protein [Diplocarpon rosae]
MSLQHLIRRSVFRAATAKTQIRSITASSTSTPFVVSLRTVSLSAPSAFRSYSDDAQAPASSDGEAHAVERAVEAAHTSASTHSSDSASPSNSESSHSSLADAAGDAAADLGAFQGSERKPYEDRRGSGGYGDRNSSNGGGYGARGGDRGGYGGNGGRAGGRGNYGDRPQYGGDRGGRGGFGSAPSRGGPGGRSFGDRPAPLPSSGIYVGNLLFDITQKDLEKEFGEFGEIKSVTVATDNRGLSKGFAYVEFATVEEATAAIEAKHQTVLEGRRLVVNFMNKRDGRNSGESPPSKTLFIGNLAFEMSDADLNKLFRDIRNVIDVRVAIDRRTGQPRGFAHADFVDVESAVKGMEALAGKEVYGRTLRVDFSAGTRDARDEVSAPSEMSRD